MSGPKLSAAEIERLQREKLERERREALRKLQEAQQAYRQACERMACAKRRIFSLLQQMDAMYAAGAKKAVDEALACCTAEGVLNDKDPQAYQAATQALAADATRMEALLGGLLSKLADRSKADQKLSGADVIHQSFQSFVDSQTDPVDVKSIDFTSNYEQESLLEKIGNVWKHCKWLSVHGQTEAERQFAHKSANAIQKNILSNPNALRRQDMIGYIQSILNEEADIRRREAEKQAAYAEYTALAAMLDIEPKPPAAFAGVQAIRTVIAELNTLFRRKDEMDYIADQINDAMISLGYGFVTSKVLLRKDSSEMDCSLYQADDRTGIAVYTDQTGAVMMRMTVLGNDSDITDDDRDFSLQRQIDFCAGHADIVDELARRGIFLKQKSYLEPDRKYTYKVNMGTGQTASQKDAAGRTVLKKNRVNRRKRRRANKKKVRAM